jgi:hypothetical protein
MNQRRYELYLAERRKAERPSPASREPMVLSPAASVLFPSRLVRKYTGGGERCGTDRARLLSGSQIRRNRAPLGRGRVLEHEETYSS